MPMQNHMQAKIRDKNSISYAWIFARLAQTRGKRSISDAWIFAPFFCLENDLHSKAHNVTHQITPALHTFFFFFSGILFLCAIVMGNKAHETSWNSTFLGYTPNYFWGNWFQSKGTQNTRWLHKYSFWEYCNDFVKNVFGYLHSFRRMSWANYWTCIIMVHVWRVHGAIFKRADSLLSKGTETYSNLQATACAVKYVV